MDHSQFSNPRHESVDAQIIRNNPEAYEDEMNYDNNFLLGDVEEDLWGNSYTHYGSGRVAAPTECALPQRLRVNGDFPAVAIKFGHAEFVFPAHRLTGRWDDFPRVYRCAGDNCLACASGVKKVTQRVEFFFVPKTSELAYLDYAVSSKPGSLDSLLQTALQGKFPALISMLKLDQYTYTVERLEFSPNYKLDEGHLIEIISNFKKNGKEIVDRLFPVMSEGDIRNSPEASEMIQILGL